MRFTIPVFVRLRAGDLLWVRVMGGPADGAEWLVSGGGFPDRIRLARNPLTAVDMPWIWLPDEPSGGLVYERAETVEQFSFERVFYPAS